jgi:hypothetical protein
MTRAYLFNLASWGCRLARSSRNIRGHKSLSAQNVSYPHTILISKVDRFMLPGPKAAASVDVTYDFIVSRQNVETSSGGSGGPVERITRQIKNKLADTKCFMCRDLIETHQWELRDERMCSEHDKRTPIYLI